MAHLRRVARAGVLAWLVLAGGLLNLPTNASPAADTPTSDAAVTLPATADSLAPPAEPAELPPTANDTSGFTPEPSVRS
jgi:hypothetical protein